MNLSDKPLSNDAKCAMGYGLKFAASNQNSNYVYVAKGVCNLEKVGDIPAQDINICKGFVYSALATPCLPSCPKRFLVALNNLKKDKDLHITRADKSNCVVILNKTDYIEKMETLLSDEDTYTKINKNPLETVNSEFNKKLKGYLVGHNDLIKKLSTISPSLPYMYGLIKTHKTNNPVRPIICSIGSCSYKLSKWLVSLLSPLVGRISNSHVKHNVDLIEKLNGLHFSFDFKLVSFDVTSLFTRVPVSDLLAFLGEELKKHELPLPVHTIINLIKLCVVDSKFAFNGEFYTQKFGMGMGNPLSPVLSNLFMEFFERDLLPNILPENVIWLRYVDDVLCMWPNDHHLSDFLPKLNNLVPSIKFTTEVEQNNMLPFLDVTIHRCGRYFKFDVFRKPTNVLSYIHFYSYHHQKTKLSVFSSMFLRSFRVCSPEFLDNELIRIYEIANNLKYPRHLIDMAHKMARKSYYNNTMEKQFSKKNILAIPFHEKLVRLPRILSLFNIQIVFKNNNTINKLLIRNSPRNNDGCVYNIPCTDCNFSYIGQTGKGLEMRISQHKYSIRTGQLSSGLFVHVRDYNHKIDWSNARKIAASNSIMERNIIESCCIKQTFSCNMNLSMGLYKLDNFIMMKIVQGYSRAPRTV